MVDEQTIAVYDQEVGAYREMIGSKPTDSTLLAFIRRIRPGGFVLDLGCGPALASSIMRERGLLVDPVDASDQMVGIANSTYDIGARKATFEDIDADNAYDGIWANFSLLHVPASEFTKIVTALHFSLKPEGVFHLGMKTGTGADRDRFGRFYTYYSQAALTDILTAVGFKVETVETGEDKGLAGDVSPWVALSCRAVKERP